MKTRLSVPVVLTLSVAVAAVWCTNFRAQAATPIVGDVILVLEGAVGQHGQAKDLELTAECSDGTLKGVWGVAERYNKMVHEGVVKKASVTSDQIDVTLDVLINPDQFVFGGWATYTISVSRAEIPNRPGTNEKGYVLSPHPSLTTGHAIASLQGEFSGTYDSPSGAQEFSGKAKGIVLPLTRPPKDFVPPAEHEHPRLLFRKDEVPALRTKLKTPLGRALMQKLNERAARQTKRGNESDDSFVASAMVALLLKDKAAADYVLKQLKGGKDFAELAKEKSLDKTTKEKGGEISDWVERGSYIPGIGDSKEATDAKNDGFNRTVLG